MDVLLRAEGTSIDQWENARARFLYPPVCLIECERTDTRAVVAVEEYDLYLAEHRLESAAALDAWHHDRIHAPDPRTRLATLLSIFYWGYYASPRDPNRRNGYVLARTKVLVQGRARRARPVISQSLAALDEALRYARCGSAGVEDAIRAVVRIPYAGVSFGSKVLAFAAPETAVVYDEVVRRILEGWARVDSTVAPMVVAKNASMERRFAAYTRWCSWCVAKAAELNAAPSAQRRWRAVDVERAVFSFGG